MRNWVTSIAAAFLLCQAATSAENGLFVGEPKLYDDYALEQMLIQAEESLGRLELIQAEAVTGAIGRIQGAEVTRTQFGLTAAELPTPNVQQTDSATPSTVTTTSPVVPAPGTAPTPPEFTLPSTFGPSAIDNLEEMLQLSLNLANLRLLLRGSLTDQVSYVGDEVVPRSRFTFGFPISIATPSSRQYRDAVAEVEVRITLDPDCAPTGSRPGLKMVLPREKTYNVAQIKSKATSLGAGVVAGIFNLGGNWIRGQSKYFLVHDQDTVAFEDASDSSNQIVFGWRFKPVLGQRKVQPGPREVFAQLTFPIPEGAAALGTAEVITRWRRYERKTGALGEVISQLPSDNRVFELQQLDLAPGPVVLSFLDLGNGKVRAGLHPELKFFEGTTFRLGGSSAIEVKGPTDHFELDFSPLDALRQGVFVGVRGQRERLLVNHCTDTGPAAARPPKCEPIPSLRLAEERRSAVLQAQQNAGQLIPTAKVLCADDLSGFKIQKVTTQAVGSDSTRIRVVLDKLAKQRGTGDLDLLTVVADKVFGLRNTPYEKYERSQDGSGVIEFVVDHATLQKATEVEVFRLLWGPDYRDSMAVDLKPKVGMSKHTVLSDSGGLLIVLEGQGLDQADIIFPPTAVIQRRGPAFAVAFIPKTASDGLKHLALQAGNETPVLVDLSKSSATPEKPVLNPPDPVKVGSRVEFPITWKNGAELEAVIHKEKAQTLIDPTKTSATVRLDDALTARPGKVALSVVFKDGTKLPLTLQVVDQHVAVFQP